MRVLTPVHRWLGILFFLLFAMWFASGIVMHFVPFPALTEADLAQIRRWLVEPHVSRWWADPPRETYPEDELDKEFDKFGQALERARDEYEDVKESEQILDVIVPKAPEAAPAAAPPAEPPPAP